MIPKPVSGPSATNLKAAQSSAQPLSPSPAVIISQPQAVQETDNGLFARAKYFRIFGDAIYRGLVRTGETVYPWLRLGRPLTELVRYFGIGSVEKALIKQKLTRNDVITSFRRSLENSLATVAFEPNKFDGRLARMAVGFLNRLVRIGVRIVLLALSFISPDNINPLDFVDESLFSSFPRGICFFATSDPVLGTVIRSGEQLVMNAGFESGLAGKVAKKLNLKAA